MTWCWPTWTGRGQQSRAALTEDGQVDEYRGCTFVNAAVEYGQPDHPVRLMALRTGYVFSTGLEEDTGWAAQFVAAHDRIVTQR